MIIRKLSCGNHYVTMKTRVMLPLKLKKLRQYTRHKLGGNLVDRLHACVSVLFYVSIICVNNAF